jgi:hypothetical protein
MKRYYFIAILAFAAVATVEKSFLFASACVAVALVLSNVKTSDSV